MNDLAIRYAAALYDLSEDEAAFVETAQGLMDQPDLWEALNSPVIRSAEKRAVLARLPLLQGREILLHFFQLLCDKGRMALLPEILAAYRAHGRAVRGEGVCQLICVHIPDAAQQAQIKQLLCRLHGKRSVRLDIRTDPALLGGLVLRMEGVTYDRSVRGQLERLERQLQERRIV